MASDTDLFDYIADMSKQLAELCRTSAPGLAAILDAASMQATIQMTLCTENETEAARRQGIDTAPARRS